MQPECIMQPARYIHYIHTSMHATFAATCITYCLSIQSDPIDLHIASSCNALAFSLCPAYAPTAIAM